MWLFYYFNIEGNYDVLKSKSPCILLNKNINKNETKSKMENPAHSFIEANLALQLIYELQIKSKTFRYQKTLLDTLFLLFSKIIESLQCILKAYLSELTILINIFRKKGAFFNHLSLPDVTNACVQIER